MPDVNRNTPLPLQHVQYRTIPNMHVIQDGIATLKNL